MEKPIRVVVAGSGDEKDLMIAPGATVSEIVDEAGLSGYQLARKGQEPFAPETDLYKEAADSETFYATPSKVAVGGGGSASLSWLVGWVKMRINDFKHWIMEWRRKVVVRLPILKQKKAWLIRTRNFRKKTKTNGLKVSHKVICKNNGARLVSLDRGIPYWQENGWMKTEKGLVGYYKTNYGNWQGFVRDNYRSSYSFYILNPPDEVMQGEHGPCFFYMGDKVHFVHFSEKPKDVSSGIMTIEQLICESFSGRRD